MIPQADIRRPPAAPGAWRILAVLISGYLAMMLLIVLLPARSTGRFDPDPAVATGARVWREAQCIACHSIYGLGGHLGPDLSNAISRLGAESVAAKVTAGGWKMPAFAFSEDETESLLAWLSRIDDTGTYPLPHPFAPGYGDIR